MYTRIKNSLAFRLVHFYKLFVKRSPPKHITNKRVDCTLVTCCGTSHLNMLFNSLYSLLKNWEYLPKNIIIYSDGTITTLNLKKQLRKYYPIVEVADTTELLNKTSNKYLLDFAENSAVGKKLAIINYHSKSTPTFWCDADILWYKSFDIATEVKQAMLKKIFIKTTEDYQPAYSKYIDIPQTKPFINTGIVLLNGDLTLEKSFDSLLENRQYNHFTEQSVIAFFSKKYSCNTWSMEDIYIGQSDNLKIMPKYLFKKHTWIARHYVGPVRHLFWRDAFFKL